MIQQQEQWLAQCRQWAQSDISLAAAMGRKLSWHLWVESGRYVMSQGRTSNGGIGLLDVRRTLAAILVSFLILAQPTHSRPNQGLKFKLATDPALRVGQIVTEGYVSIYATGEIEDGDAARFAEFVRRQHLDAAKVVFDSPGGSLFEGVKLGRTIRALNFDTDIGTEESAAGSGR